MLHVFTFIATVNNAKELADLEIESTEYLPLNFIGVDSNGHTLGNSNFQMGGCGCCNGDYRWPIAIYSTVVVVQA